MPDNLLTNAFVSLDLVGVVVVGGVEPVVVVVATAIGYCARARLSDNCCSKSDPATTDPDCAIGSEVTSLYCPFFFSFFSFFLQSPEKVGRTLWTKTIARRCGFRVCWVTAAGTDSDGR